MPRILQVFSGGKGKRLSLNLEGASFLIDLTSCLACAVLLISNSVEPE